MVKLIKNNLLTITLITFFVVIPVTSFADITNTGCDPAKQICNPITESTIQGFIRTVLEGVLKIGIPLVALAVIYCGFLFVAARGNSEKLTKAKDALLYTLIGAAILLGSWAIAKLIADTVISLK